MTLMKTFLMVAVSRIAGDEDDLIAVSFTPDGRKLLQEPGKEFGF